MSSAVTLAQDLIRIDTCGGGELAAAQLIAQRLEAAGMQVRIDRFDGNRANLVATTRGGAEKQLVLSGHLDTVPAGAVAWSDDPLGGACRGGRLYGRGASDMKSGVAALVVALEHHLRSRRPHAALALVLTAGEETGCAGARRLADRGMLPAAHALLVAEPTANRLTPGHKGALWLELTAKGRAAHGSTPHLGQSAIALLARLAVALHEYGLPGEHPVMGPVSVNVGTFTGGTRTNLVPDSAVMTADIRLVPGVTAAETRAHIAAVAGEAVTIETILEMPAVYAPPGDAFVTRVAAALEAAGVHAHAAAPATYFTDASVLGPALGSPSVVLLGPGDPDQAHATDESCAVERIDEAVAVYVALLDGLRR
jgi:succinyl-diaminopimelate desuccinylase